MAHNAIHREARQASVTLADLERELHRLIESKIILVSMAGKLGAGGAPVLLCSSGGDPLFILRVGLAGVPRTFRERSRQLIPARRHIRPKSIRAD